ncbi:unnamed protein product [Allacma fusca]|uniref:BTB domain-containing protein n=1 Tax=Allacma fusca TaxID=39272 RepID=A0A8J2JC64_9HEXA|nr:unnamed protein product [Allacma fusca]
MKQDSKEHSKQTNFDLRIKNKSFRGSKQERPWPCLCITMFHPRGGNASGSNDRQNRGDAGSSRGSNSTNAPSPKKPCNRVDENLQRDSKSQLCEVDNSIALISKIAALYAERLMSDITLVINGVEFPAHRLILCASSDVFQVMLMNPNWSESQKNTVVLQESPDCALWFEDFLKYLYTGSLKLTLKNVLHLLTLADKYNVKDLINLCLNYMIAHIPAAGTNNQLIQWYQYAANCGHETVANDCRDFIKWNFDSMSKAEDFHHLDLELLTSILIEDDVVIYDEFALFFCVDNWISCQRDKIPANDPNLEERMLQIVQESMGCIRFPMMSPRQLADLLLCPLTQKYKEYLMERMTIGMAFHSDRWYELISPIPTKNKLLTPRLYMTDKWSVCMTVENFSRMDHFQSKTLVFSTPVSFAEKVERQVEWVVDFYPKGVCFFKHFLIIWQGTVEIPEHVMQTVRLSVLCKSEEETDVKVQIGILVAGSQDGVDHIIKCVRRNYIFTKNDRILNFDDLLPYWELTQCANCHIQNENEDEMPTRFNNAPPSNSAPPTHRSRRESSEAANPCCSYAKSGSNKSCYLVGNNHDSLKIKIVITPKSEYDF